VILEKPSFDATSKTEIADCTGAAASALIIKGIFLLFLLAVNALIIKIN
jgi:hypothetical protein